ncbi:protoporphyrinogen oxidase HemJ [Amaricoccus sp.]|uniref:protoporphyrinogen oxidase HemJ n=1 Tax=Amaricoccus sp. TaxID=1872485 RepID=UPI002628250D|nr:protoporphyrinogen oxidase HemJ [Amaricoccus sp.]HRO12165.1 protoporphyrinogen oxidase HemJ [Amaricoccus sp.]
MSHLLTVAYPWIKALHLAAAISWMAGLFYLPRLFVYHAERGTPGSELSETFKVMERRLLHYIMRPAMMVTWALGLTLALTPGVVGWTTQGWFYVKLATVIGLSAFHEWLVRRCADFAGDRNRLAGRTYRLANELPTLALLVIVVMVIVKPF